MDDGPWPPLPSPPSPPGPLRSHHPPASGPAQRLRFPAGRRPTCAFQTSGASAPCEKLPARPPRPRGPLTQTQSICEALPGTGSEVLNAPQSRARARAATRRDSQSVPNSAFPSAHVTRPRRRAGLPPLRVRALARRGRAHVTLLRAFSPGTRHHLSCLTSVHSDLVNGVWGDVSPGVTVKLPEREKLLGEGRRLRQTT